MQGHSGQFRFTRIPQRDVSALFFGLFEFRRIYHSTRLLNTLSADSVHCLFDNVTRAFLASLKFVPRQWSTSLWLDTHGFEIVSAGVFSGRLRQNAAQIRRRTRNPRSPTALWPRTTKCQNDQHRKTAPQETNATRHMTQPNSRCLV